MDQIGKQSTAQTLLEQLDEAEEEGAEGHGLQQENNDELREQSSSQILRFHEGQNQTCSRCQDLEMELEDSRTEVKAEQNKTKQLQLKHNEEMQTRECDQVMAERNRLSSENELLRKEVNEWQLKCKYLQEKITKARTS
ncbi:hypothetical protein OS493_021998 [Desmophyllum pertusum]|uniref:Uncharacterized protein n=1 Tax=Desmophyllum pertusum TaxID=174260 RepID=A0A9W9YYV9_9CNID|nr:hypothetical protein OS493_021998 [Desmophyllum pertusum]